MPQGNTSLLVVGDCKLYFTGENCTT